MIRLGELARLAGATLVASDGMPPAAAVEAVEVGDMEHDSRLVRPGAVFACIPGERADGHDYAGAAVGAGARALLAERLVPLDPPAPVLVVKSVRRALGPAAAAVHGRPSERLDLIGVTGTDGKTTTVGLIAWLLAAAGCGVGQIGTLTGPRTTPEATDLQRQLAAAVSWGDSAVAMEVSSHALVQHRVDGCRFRVAVFTNLGHDHLDYHGSPEDYFRAKARLFRPDMADRAVINVDTPEGRRLADAVARTMPVVEVGAHRADPIGVGPRSSSFLWRSQRVRLPLGGSFHLVNAVTAAEVAVSLGLSPGFIAEALAEAPQIPGRFEPVDAGQDFTVIVDYAHTPDGIKAVLQAARPAAGGRLTVVFGAGGDRDRLKRPAMGRAAEAWADRVVVTTDNPRSEDPHRIIADVVAGMRRPPERVEADRRLAVRHALTAATPGDVVVIAGRGAESVQTVGSDALAFDDRLVVMEELSRLPESGERVAAGHAAEGGPR